MRIDVVTLFPEMIEHAAGFGVTGRARERSLWQLCVWNPRDYAHDARGTVDDRPYGGGPGMVMLAEPLAQAIAAAREAQRAAGVAAPRTIHLTPAGAPLTHARVIELAHAENAGYVLIAGRYEGIDERVVAREADEEIAIGEFVVSGGELPALVIVDAVARLIPGVVGDEASVAGDTFARDGLLDFPQYTRPAEFRGHAVPPVLLSGHHAEIEKWRREQALERTRRHRPDLLGDS